MGSKKLYTVYLPKKKGATTNNLVKWIQLYSRLTRANNNIIVSPGYMSTTRRSISRYLSNLSTSIGHYTSGKKPLFGILNGMNGSRKLSSTTMKIIDAHKDSIAKDLPQKDYFDNVNLKTNNDPDHRKVMVFFDGGDSFKNTAIDKTNFKLFLDEVTVNAVLLGSSNQSHTTYFGSPASKGEADIFMMCIEEPASRTLIGLLRSIATANDVQLLDDELVEYNELIESVTVSEAFDGKNSDDPHEFLKDILDDLLETGLM